MTHNESKYTPMLIYIIWLTPNHAKFYVIKHGVFKDIFTTPGRVTTRIAITKQTIFFNFKQEKSRILILERDITNPTPTQNLVKELSPTFFRYSNIGQYLDCFLELIAYLHHYFCNKSRLNMNKLLIF